MAVESVVTPLFTAAQQEREDSNIPIFNTTTKYGESVWKSPDGQREIFKVTLDYDGKEVAAKTYSKDISVPGWAGQVETYEKPGRNGSETFVKQPPKEGFSGGGYTGGGTVKAADSASKPSYGVKTEEQQESIARSVALKAAVDTTAEATDPAEIVEISEIFLTFLQGGSESEDPKVDHGEQTDTTTSPEPSMEELNSIFGGEEIKEDKPWNKT